ncbi:hypothetical protein RMSM_01981 [Rhodopirellula maiorica SM1]|uniref:Uncharacterized protein n=1 Tax=Rhodopirellula maiorica SM1 TaxID=1265738 RepID=M5RP83_9BACT|nr:hypothetical protein RMSM_01981 [Rhodopirellula maiorica SM1]
MLFEYSLLYINGLARENFSYRDLRFCGNSSNATGLDLMSPPSFM